MDWKERQLTVNNLLLDTLNPRLPESESNLSQRQLIEELVREDEVYELAKQIVENGYFPVEALIVIVQNGKKIVVEGNRRLAALKLLLDPGKAPKASVRKFKSLAKRLDGDEIRKVKVIIAPSRDEADVYIANKHTPIGGPKNWSRLQQASFYKQKLDAGRSITHIAEMFSTTDGEVTKELKLLTMHSVACALDLPEAVAEKVKNMRVFPASTLQRVYDNIDIRKWLGIEFQAHHLKGSLNKDEFVKGFSKIVTDIAKGVLTSRSHNKKEDIIEYLEKIDKYKPNQRRKGEFTCSDFEIVEDDNEPTAKKTSESKKAATPKQRLKLIPNGYKFNVNNQRVTEVFTELKKLKFKDHRNAIAILLRCLLEMSLIHFSEETNRTKDLVKHYSKKNKRKKDWHPSLNQMLSYFVEHDITISNSLNPVAIKAIKKLTGADRGLYTTDFLHAFVHNLYMPNDPETLLTFWDQLEPIFDVILREPYNEE